MPPKKAAVKGSAKPDGPVNGIVEEGCQLPLWDEADIAAEHWGGDLTAQQVEPSLQFVDAEFPSTLESIFQSIIQGWKRPTGIFSPFKPMVLRPQSHVLLFGNPYIFNAGTADRELLEEGGERIESHNDAIALYRRMRSIVVPNPDGATANTSPLLMSEQESSPARRRMRRRQYKGDPSFMRAFNCALLILSQNQAVVPQGRYAWELIYPQAATTGFPVYNVWGKYVVKLFFKGAYRKVVLDDRLPVDSNGDCILSVTDQKEIWPALLLKAMLKALGPQYERRVLDDPLFILSCLLGGSMPERIPMAMKEMRLADAIRKQQKYPGRWVLCCTVKRDGIASNNNSTGRSANGASSHQQYASTDPSGERTRDRLGLEPNQLYNVMEARQYQNTMAVRLCGMGAQWRGKFAYSSASWTAEVEDTLHFDPNIHRNKHELGKQWNDFWVPWEDFIEEFQYLYVMHPVIQDTAAYGCFKQLTVQEQPNPAPIIPMKPTRETPRNAALHINAAHMSAIGDPNAPTIKWLSFKPRPDGISEMVVVLLGLGRPLPSPPRVSNAAATANASLTAAATGAMGSAPSVGFLPGSGPYGGDTFSIVIDRYRWRDSGPFCRVLSYSGPWDAYATFPFVIPQSTENVLYRVTVRGLPQDAAISFMGNNDFTLGEEKDILRDMSIFTVTDAGRYAAHEPNIATIWFKRWFSVKTHTTANFSLKTIPRQVDTTPFRMALTDSTQPKAKAGPGSKGGAGGKNGSPMSGGKGSRSGDLGDVSGNTPHPPSKPISPVPLEEELEEMTVIESASLVLLDLDSGEPVAQDHLAQILGAELAPNKSGYVLTASATPKVSRMAGQWKLRITSDNPIEGVEQRSTDEVHVRSGSYHHNTSRTLFSFNITAAELTTASLQLSLFGAPPGVAFLVQVIQADKEIKRLASNHCVIPHITFPPPDKGQPNVCKLIGTLEQDYALQEEEKRVSAVAERFEADVAAQAEHAEALREELLEKFAEAGEAMRSASADGTGGPSASPSAAGDLTATPTKGSVGFALPNGSPPTVAITAPPSSPPLLSSAPTTGPSAPTLLAQAATLPTVINSVHDTFNITYCVRVHASSTRLDLHEDTTLTDAAAAARAAWGKQSAADAIASGGGAAKGGGGAAAKGGNPKGQTTAPDEVTARSSKAKDARLRFLSNPTSVFIPFTNNNNNNNAVVYTDAAPDGGPASYRVAPIAPTSAAVVKEERMKATTEVPTKTSALLPTVFPGTPQHKSALLAILAKVEDGLAEQSKQRKDVFMSASNLILNSYDIKPQTTEVEDDKKKPVRKR